MILQQTFTYLIHINKDFSSIDTRFFTASIATCLFVSINIIQQQLFYHITLSAACQAVPPLPHDKRMNDFNHSISILPIF